MLRAVLHFVAEREGHAQPALWLWFYLHLTGNPEAPLRPARRVTLQVAADLLPSDDTVVVVMDAVSKELQLRADLRIQSCEHEGSDVIAETCRTQHHFRTVIAR